MAATNVQHHGNERITWKCGECGHEGSIVAHCTHDGVARSISTNYCAHVDTVLLIPRSETDKHIDSLRPTSPTKQLNLLKDAIRPGSH
mgnify:CR=1 FL=1